MLLHILAWRKFVLSKVNQEAIDIIIDSDDDWPALYSEPKDIIEELHKSYHDLQFALHTKTDDWLKTTVPNKEYSYEVMLYGLMNHDIHHFAQILIIDKEVSSGQLTSGQQIVDSWSEAEILALSKAKVGMDSGK